MEAEGLPAGLGRCRFREERVPGSISHAFPRPLDNPQTDELGPAPREWKEGFHHRRQRVAGADEPLSLPRDVGEPPGKDLHERDDAVRKAFLDPHDEGVRSEDLNQEER